MIHLKKPLLSTLSLIFSIALILGMMPIHTAYANSSTGVGLCAHALNAYYENWSYVYGGSSYGTVDCSGLIYTYNGVGGWRSDMLGASSESGYVCNGIPNIHGLGLHQPGHVGVYVGGGMAVDARSEYYGMCYQSVYTKSWTSWFKVSGVSYPSNGWVKLSGDSYYYENGEYITNTSRTLGGVTYTFDSIGRSNISPDSSAYLATDYSSTSVSNDYSSSNDSYSDDYYYEEEEEVVEEAEEEEEPEASDSYTTLYSGSMGNAVERLQERLKNLGYFNDDVTNFYGALTEAAITSFQENAELSITGVADNTTQELLFSDSAPIMEIKNFSIGDYSDEILEVQERLIELGYFYDDATGYYGEVTAIAVSQFQSANGLISTGEVDTLTSDVLFSDNAYQNPNKGTISYGMQGDSVRAMQQRLIDLRYLTGVPTEVFDDATLQAVNSYQTTLGIDTSDSLTSEEITALYSTDAPKSSDYTNLALGYIGDDIRDLQIRLSALGYFDGILNGYFCEITQQAVKAAQVDLGFEESGIATEEFRTALSQKLEEKSLDSNERVTIVTETMARNALANAAELDFETAIAAKDRTYLAYLIVGAIAIVVLMATVVLYNTLLKKNEFQQKALAFTDKVVKSRTNNHSNANKSRPVKIKRTYFFEKK